jgi:hypothetical protein
MASQVQAVISGYLEKLGKECREKGWSILHPGKPAVTAEIQADAPEIQIAFLKTVLANAGALAPGHGRIEETVLGKMFPGLFSPKPTAQRLTGIEFSALGGVVSHLLRGKLLFPAQDLADVVRSYAKNIGFIRFGFSLGSVISAVESCPRTSEVESAMRRLRDSFANFIQHFNTKENRGFLERIDQYLEPRKKQELPVGGPWSSTVLAEIGHQPEAARNHWVEVFGHCLAAQSTTPSKAWRKRAKELIASVGPRQLQESAVRWLNPDVVPLTGNPASHISDKDADYLKGFVWLLADLEGLKPCKEVADLGLACLRKIPSVGPVSARVGFACVNSLAEMPGKEPVAQLTRMRIKVKYAVALNLIEKALNAAAARSGLSRDDLEDIAVPNYGLDAQLKLSDTVGNSRVDLVLNPGSGEIESLWRNAEGKAVKSPPAEIKQNHASRLKELKRTAADLQKMLSAQRLRIEQSLMNERKMGYEHWRKHFFEHPILSAIGKRLIWRFDSGNWQSLGACWDGQIVNWDNSPVDGLGPETKVQLWHPLQSDPQTILSWRCWLEDHHVVQPFKQAHREVYILTPAEEQTESYSNRFAAHVIRQHQFASLCRERGWRYRLMGSGFDGHNVPTLEVPARRLRAEFWVDIAEGNAGTDPRQASDQVSGSGINVYLFTDQVRFYQDGAPVRLADVPPVVLSEVMRDVDLFVGVTSIGNDPTWFDRGDVGFGEYWRAFAFGDLSQSGETRSAILKNLLPQLKIASRCTLEGKFLVVRGDLHTYKIHLGSANVLMEPGSHYLCIVPGHGLGSWERGSLYLPFEGDHTLAVILSKAMLLAADKKITDETILRQIGRPGPVAH